MDKFIVDDRGLVIIFSKCVIVFLLVLFIKVD